MLYAKITEISTSYDLLVVWRLDSHVTKEFIDIRMKQTSVKIIGNMTTIIDTCHLNEINQMEVTECRKELSDHRNIWDWIKYNIRAHAIKYSKKKAKERNERGSKLEKEYTEAKQVFETNPNDSNGDNLNAAKDKLESFYDEKVNGIIIRARARWHEHGEKSTKYFLNLEKRNHVKKHIRKLVISGVVKTDPYDILQEQKRFYRELYKSSNSDAENRQNIVKFLENLNIPQLTEEQKLTCEDKISAEECYNILESFQTNKTPGNDGIPIEFYKVFWPLISDPFLKCVNESFEKGEMSCSQKQAVITLIEKKGKDRSYIENWRPISLVNVDTKIMSKVIATRIKNVLPNIIHHNQTGYVKDRYIGETIRSVFDIMDFTAKESIPGLMIFIDFEKAFDSVEWEFLLYCLKSFNFGPNFIHWVQTFYRKIQSCVINNGLSSEYFNLERGVRQGDPLSPYLFVVTIETLAIAIRQNKDIKGISIGNEETKILQYADDTTAILADTSSATALFRLLDDFKIVSGLKINCSKTEAMWIGSSRNCKAQPFGIKWPNEPIKALGIYYTYDQKLLLEKNFIERLDSIKNLTRIWSSRGLSIYGKITLIKSLLIPKFVYVSSLLPTPKEFVSQLNQLLFQFLWNGPDKVTRKSAINEYSNGGLKMIDLDSMIISLRLAWLKRIASSNDGTWKRYLTHHLERFGGLFLFHCNYDVSILPLNISLFYLELLQWWSEFRDTFSPEKDWRYILWNNKQILINNKTVYYKSYFEAGVVHISDLSFDLNNKDSFSLVSNRISKTNFLVWAGLRHSIPSILKNCTHKLTTDEFSLKIDDNIFDVTKKKSKDYYSLLVSRKALFPTIVNKLQNEFHFTLEEVKQIFMIPHSVALEAYVKAFQYKILNSILYTNAKLYKIGFKLNDSCSFCSSEPETLYHFLYLCPFSIDFWRDFEVFWHQLLKENIRLSLQDILVGMIRQNSPSAKLLNYLIMIGKLYLWDCRRSQILPNIYGFKKKIAVKYETEKYISLHSKKTKDFFEAKWIVSPLANA